MIYYILFQDDIEGNGIKVVPAAAEKAGLKVQPAGGQSDSWKLTGTAESICLFCESIGCDWNDFDLFCAE